MLERIAILFVILTLLDATHEVCMKSCNDNGFCYTENGIEKCNCLDRIYVGESCKQLVNHCDGSPCENGGKCISEAGQYICLCAENFFGQNCTSKRKLFGQLYLQYNHIAPVGGNDNHFLMILTDLGTVRSLVEMETSDYAIVGDVTISSDSGDFLQTNDIRAIAEQFNIPLSSSIPIGPIFYHAGKYRMPNPGIVTVTLTIMDVTDSSVYYAGYFHFGSMENVGCNPVIEIKSCGVPRAPTYVNVNQPIFLEANIQRDCGRDSIVSHNWSISNYFDTKTLQSFDGGSRTLKIPPFNILISYNSENVYSRFNLIKLVSLETSVDGTKSGGAINRVIQNL